MWDARASFTILSGWYLDTKLIIQNEVISVDICPFNQNGLIASHLTQFNLQHLYQFK